MKYLGWVVVEHNPGYRDSFWAEWLDAEGKRHWSNKFHSPAEVIDWWDKKVGAPVSVMSTPLGAYRVFVGDGDVKADQPWWKDAESH
jgi:hypothetical protein